MDSSHILSYFCKKGNGWFERLKNKKINNKEWKRLGDGLARKTR